MDKNNQTVDTHALGEQQLVVSTTVTGDVVKVTVHLKSGDKTVALYTKNHALNGETIGVATLSSASLAADPTSRAPALNQLAHYAPDDIVQGSDDVAAPAQPMSSFRAHLRAAATAVEGWPAWKTGLWGAAPAQVAQAESASAERKLELAEQQTHGCGRPGGYWGICPPCIAHAHTTKSTGS